MLGRVHSIDSFSTLDGPGIRMVVFLQGCHLQCKYCQNPDTWEMNSPTTMLLSSRQIVDRLKRGCSYYQPSEGGITFSGGEPLLQHSFVREVFEECHAIGLTTALDTSLYVQSRHIASVLPVTDLVLADIKHMDPARSIDLTGHNNQRSLSNLELINSQGVPIWIRYVIVPGWTDAPADLEAMAKLAGRLEHVARIELLAYHTLGLHKWALLNRPYTLAGVVPPHPSQLEEWRIRVAFISQKPVYVY